MKQLLLVLTLTAALLLPSCKKPVDNIKGRVLMQTIPYDPVEEGLPVSIFRDNKLYTVAYTDTGGHFQFSTTEFSNEELERYSAYFLNSGPFDSTLTEWRYITDSTYLQHASQWGEITEPQEDWMIQLLYFSHLKHFVYNPGSNQFKVVPSGWLLFKVLNHTSFVYVHHYYQSYDTFFGDMSKPFMLIPERTYKFRVSESTPDGYVDFTFTHYVRNSIDPSSTPGNVRLVPDTIIIDMQTRSVEVVRAVF